MTPSLRLVPAGDDPALWDDLVQRYLREMTKFDPRLSPDADGRIEADWPGLHPTADRQLAYCDGVAVAFVAVRHGIAVHQVQELFVVPEARRSGVARTLVELLAGTCRGHWLAWFIPQNPAAAAFWAHVAGSNGGTCKDDLAAWRTGREFSLCSAEGAWWTPTGSGTDSGDPVRASGH